MRTYTDYHEIGVQYWALTMQCLIIWRQWTWSFCNLCSLACYSNKLVPIQITNYSKTKPLQGLLCSLLTRSYQTKFLQKQMFKCSSSDNLYPVVIKEDKHELSIQETIVRDEDTTFESSANIQLKRNSNFPYWTVWGTTVMWEKSNILWWKMCWHKISECK